MIIAEVNGTRVEAENLKEMNKLIKKEEKRQEAERKEQDRKHDKALLTAYAALGKVSRMTLRATSFCWQPEHLSIFVKNDSLQVLAMDEEKAEVSSNRAIVAILIDVQGHTLAVKSRYSWSDRDEDIEENWDCYGAYQGAHASVAAPELIATHLNSWLAHYQQATMQQAA